MIFIRISNFALRLLQCAALWLAVSCAIAQPVVNKPKGVHAILPNYRPSVVFISCCLANGFFWPQVEAFMRAAAKDLNMDLEVQYGEMNHLRMIDLAMKVIHRPKPPDYIIVDNYKQMAEPIIKEAELAGVNTFLMANGFLPPQSERMGTPRSKFKHWIGELDVDNYEAGFELAERLFAEVRKKGFKGSDGKFHLVALGGDSSTPAGLERIRGLNAAESKNSDFVINQIVNGSWQEDTARQLTSPILKRYPEVCGVWAANDEMALGVLAGASAIGRKPGIDIFIGGINWKREALNQVREGKLVVSYGGHFMMGGIALVMLYDHFHGRDFDDQGVDLEIPMFKPMERDAVKGYINKIGDDNWDRIDFAALSRFKRPQNKRYDFSVKKLLEGIKRHGDARTN